MARKPLVCRTALLTVALVAAACGPDGPTLVASDEIGEVTTDVADDSPPTERDVPLSQLVQGELVLGYVWQLNRNAVVEDWARLTFYGSENNPKIQIESQCGVGDLEIERRRSAEYRISNSSWDGCDDDTLRTLLDDAGALTASTTVQSFGTLSMQIGREEFSLNQLDGLPFSTDEFGYPDWTLNRVEDDVEEIRPDFVPVPNLSPEDIAAEPLMKNMTLIEDLEDTPDLLDYLAIIGSSQYALVDESGEPIIVRDGSENKLRLMITAYYGAETPVVYVAFMDHYSHIDPTYGVQSGSDCEGGMSLGGLLAGPSNTYEFSNRTAPVFDNRIFFGDYLCGGYDLNPRPEILDDRFTIDTSVEDTLTMTTEDGTTTRFLLLETN